LDFIGSFWKVFWWGGGNHIDTIMH
jgi:hypothetical protein